MSIDNIILIAYAIFLIAGAFMGFKAGSKVSLIMGLVSGILVLWGVYLIGSSPKVGWGFIGSINGILAVVFISRFLKTKKFIPSGMLLIASFLVTGFCLIRLMNIY